MKHKNGELDVAAGQAVIAHGGEWIQYSTPAEGGAEYIAVCLPAFAMETVHRDTYRSVILSVVAASLREAARSRRTPMRLMRSVPMDLILIVLQERMLRLPPRRSFLQ